MARDGSIRVAILGDASSLHRALRSADMGASRFGSAMRSAGRVAAVGVGAAVAGLGLLGKESVDAASTLGESISKANVIFGRNADVVQKWSESTASAFGVSRSEALEAASGYMAMFKSAGLAEDAATDMSTSVAELAADMASMHNADPTEMLDKLRAGLSGEAEPLRRFGVFLSEAAVQEEAVRAGIAKTGEELTDAEKIQARYNIIMRQTADAQGDVARTADSLPNVLRRLKAQFQDTAAGIGQRLIPVVSQALDALGPAFFSTLDALAPALEDIAASFGDVLPPIIKAFAPLIGSIGTVMADLAKAAAPVIRLLGRQLSRTMKELMPVLRPLIKALGEAFLAALQAITPHIPKLARSFVKIIKAITPIIPEIADLAAAFIDFMTKHGVKIIKFLTDELVPKIRGVGRAIRILRRLWNDAWTWMRDTLGPIIEAIRSKIDTLLGPLDEIAGIVSKLMGTSIGKNILSGAPGVGALVNLGSIGTDLPRAPRARAPGRNAQVGPSRGATIQNNIYVDGRRVKKNEIRRDVLMGNT